MAKELINTIILIFFYKTNTTYIEAADYFTNIELFNPAKKILNSVEIQKSQANIIVVHYALYGGMLDSKKFSDTLVLTADAMGDGRNWSVSVNDNGTLKELASGNDFLVARIYKFCTLILGMKPNEHEYKVMGLSSYSNSHKHIKEVESIFFNILDFDKGEFLSNCPLKDSYFDLKKRLEFRFDNISAALQNWTSSLVMKWSEYWLKKLVKGNSFFRRPFNEYKSEWRTFKF